MSLLLVGGKLYRDVDPFVLGAFSALWTCSQPAQVKASYLLRVTNYEPSESRTSRILASVRSEPPMLSQGRLTNPFLPEQYWLRTVCFSELPEWLFASLIPYPVIRLGTWLGAGNLFRSAPTRRILGILRASTSRRKQRARVADVTNTS